MGKIGFIGLGKIGFAIAKNIITKVSSTDDDDVDGFVHYDIDPESCRRLGEETDGKSTMSSSISDLASQCDVVFTALPNDKILLNVCGVNDKDGDDNYTTAGLISNLGETCIHVSCSTISPATSRRISTLHTTKGAGFVAAPVFARPDGMALGHATIPVSGSHQDHINRILPLLNLTATEVRTFGSDPGAANVVKLAGNFLIASAIESMGEAMALTEGCGVDREAVRSMLTDTIFDCLIYKGYGQRVARRDHAPYPNAHFALELGRKDVELVRSTAADANVPMPIASLLSDRFSCAVAKKRQDLDWSAIGLQSSEDANVDITEHLQNCRRPNPQLDWKPPT